MKFNTTMPKSLKPYFEKELDAYRLNMNENRLAVAWSYLERAHIIGQAYPYHHSYVHWEMLKFGFKIKDAREIIGQIPRLLVGGVKSFIGKIPIGNTGGANVPPLRPMPIQQDIKAIFEITGVKPNIH